MHLHFSSTFGFGNVYPALVTSTGMQVHGQMYIGAKGLLEYFELHLGEKRKDVTNALRVSAYRKTIKKLITSNPDLYFATSFQQDGWGTAQQLLVWRDELKLAGWDFDCKNTDLQRLHALAMIESHITDMPMGVNDRWSHINEVLRDWSVELSVEKVTVYEPEELMNPFFRKLFTLLSNKKVAVEYHISNRLNDQPSDLQNFKNKLVSTKKQEKVTCENDGTLLILKADNDKILADTLGEYLSHKKELKPVFVMPERGEVLEEALVRRGFPAMGITSKLVDTAFDQLMSLIPLFLWKPIDPEKLIQYLTLMDAPIKKVNRRKLAKQYVGGNEKDIDELNNDENVKQWMGKSKHNIDKGAPRADVITLYEDLKNWANGYASTIKDNENQKKSFFRLINHCNDLIQLVRSEKTETELVHTLELQKWLTTLESDQNIRKYEKEIGGFDCMSQPENIITDCETTVYWNFLKKGSPLTRSTDWSDEELAHLTVNLHVAENKIALWFKQLTNAVLRTQKQLILCIPTNKQGVAAAPNSLYNDLLATFDSLHLITRLIDVNTVLDHEDLSLKTRSYAKRELPQSSISWEIDVKDEFEKRKKESYSSLGKLFFYPCEYLLHYLLGIKPVDIPDSELSNLLRGNIAHHAAEELWKKENLFAEEPAQLNAIIQQVVDAQIEKEGAFLELAKNEIERRQFRKTTVESLAYLVNAIKNNGWQFLEAEQKHELDGAIPLRGEIDLVLKRNDEIAIVDLKWGSSSSRKQELVDGQELQLLIYDRLMKAPGKKIYLNYYIISESKFLSRSYNVFEEAEVIELNGISEEQHREQLWQKVQHTFNERWTQINLGKIEVADEFYTAKIAEIFPMWLNENQQFLTMPQDKGKKELNKYSVYKNLIGRKA